MFDKKVCINCNASIVDTLTFCPHCGSKQAKPFSEYELQKDAYGILQVSEIAEIEVIEAAFRQLAKKYHPDLSKDNQAQERMKDINWAYDILRNPVERARYDRTRQRKRSEGRKYSRPESSYTPPPRQAPPREKVYKEKEEYEKYKRKAQEEKPRPAKGTTYKTTSTQRKSPTLIAIVVFAIIAGVAYITSTLDQSQSAADRSPNPAQENVVDASRCKYSEVERWLTIATSRRDEAIKDLESRSLSSSPQYNTLLENARSRYIEARDQQTPICLEALQAIDMSFYNYEVKFYTSSAAYWYQESEANAKRLDDLGEEYNQELDRVLKQYGWD